MKLNPLANFEGVSLMIRRYGPALRQVSYDIGIMVFIPFQEKAVKGGDGLDTAISAFLMAIDGAGLVTHRVGENSTPLGLFGGGGSSCRAHNEDSKDPQTNRGNRNDFCLESFHFAPS